MSVGLREQRDFGGGRRKTCGKKTPIAISAFISQRGGIRGESSFLRPKGPSGAVEQGRSKEGRSGCKGALLSMEKRRTDGDGGFSSKGKKKERLTLRF